MKVKIEISQHEKRVLNELVDFWRSAYHNNGGLPKARSEVEKEITFLRILKKIDQAERGKK